MGKIKWRRRLRRVGTDKNTIAKYVLKNSTIEMY